MRYFYDNGTETKEFKHGTFWMKKEEFESRFPGVKGIKVDFCTMLAGAIGDQYFPVTRKVNYVTVAPSLHKCDARCMGGKCGGRCECQCGGANHGRGNV